MTQENINLVICCKNLLDGAGTEPISSGLVAIAGKRIIYAGSAAEAPAFPNALVIDLPEATLCRLITPTGGHCHLLPNFSNQADGSDDFRRAVREERRAGADFIKLANNGAELAQHELDAAVDEARRLGLKVVCHTRKRIRDFRLTSLEYEDVNGNPRDTQEVALEKFKHLNETHHPEPLPDEVLAELDRILAAAEREVG